MPSNSTSFLAELRRRRVWRVAAAYGAFALATALAVAELYDDVGLPEGTPTVVIIVLALGFPLALVLSWVFQVRREEPAAAEPHDAAATRGDRKSLVVLPFDNISPDPGDAYFAEGLHLEVTSKLQDVSAIAVLSRTSAMRYREAPLTLPQIAAELGVDYILEGTARRAGSEMRLSVRLTDGRTDEAVWTQEYAEIVGLHELLETQSNVARQVAGALSATILPEEAARIEEEGVTDLQAYDLYLRATALGHSPEDLRQSERLLEEVVKIAPTFTRAWVHLSFSRLMLWRFGSVDTLEEAQKALDTVTELSPTDPYVLMLTGIYHDWVTQDLERAIECYELAVVGRPNDVNALVSMARAHELSGRPMAARSYVERALALAPAEPDLALRAAVMYAQLHDLDRADRYMAQALRVGMEQAEIRNLAFYLYLRHLGDTERASRFLDEVKAAGYPELKWWSIDLAYHRREYEDALSAVLRDRPGGIEEDSSGYNHWPWQLVAAVLSKRLGQREQSLGYADALIEELGAPVTGNESEVAPGIRALRHGWLSMCFALKGDADAALREAARATEFAPATDWTAFIKSEVARTSVMLGREEDALDLIEELLGKPMGAGLTVPWLEVEPIWDPLRENPRYQALLDTYS